VSRRAILIAIGSVALVAVLAIGALELATRGSSHGPAPARLTAAQALQRLAGAPAPLASLHLQGGLLLEGGARALHARLRALRGWPIVIDKWASWCTSCQSERAVFQQAAVAEGKRVAFLGVDSGDHSRADAQAFLRAAFESYPSYWDPSGKLGQEVTESTFWPVTVFYTAQGSRFIHQGPYESVAELERDVERYALA
jgi:cytochrome c biogenesis protein CcmG/thiol:disulfide interchange protein DsbE